MYSFITRSALILLVALCAHIQTSFAQTDTLIGIAAPGGSGGSYQKLAHALCDDLPNDQLKANAIYNWITHNISYDVKALQQGKLKEEDPQKVFRQRKGMCAGYSLLFAAMCNEVGVKAVFLSGYSKDWMFDDGDKLYIPRHAWNAVYIDQKWRLVDATWGAGKLVQSPGWLKRKLNRAAKNPLQTSGKLKFRFEYDTAYFLSDPLVFRLRHLPSDPIWQLTSTTMPLEVFEAGEMAIQKFNKQYPQLADNSPAQDSMSRLAEKERIQASAARTFAYNPRFHVAMASKHHADAMDTIAVYANSTLITAGLALTGVQADLKQAQEEVKEQKKGIATEYAALSLKNKTKGLEAKQYINTLHSDNKRMLAQCTSRTKRTNTIATAIDKKAHTLAKSSKEINAGKLATVATTRKQEAMDSPTLTALKDSVDDRRLRIKALQENIALGEAAIVSAKETNSKRLDSLADILVIADSALTQETINRLRMHDNYDEEVLQWNRLVKTLRLEQVGRRQKAYFDAYDSVSNAYEALGKSQWELLQLCRKNLADLERYKRKNDNTAILGEYGTMVKTYSEGTTAYYGTLQAHKAYVTGHRAVFKELTQLYTRQEKLAGYMEKSEKKRQELEEKQLTKKEDFDKKENEKQNELLKSASKLAEKTLSLK